MNKRRWIEYIDKGAKNDLVGYYHVRTRAEITTEFADATFGGFRRVADGEVEYTATLWSDESGKIMHCYESEYCDDLNALRRGKVTLYN